MFLHGLATANPDASFSQTECLALALESADLQERLSRRSRLMLSTILRGDCGIERRQFAVRDIGRLFSADADALNDEFRRTAPELAEDALRPALEEAGCAPRDLDALVICTCTGYLCPGLSSYVAERIGLRPDAWLQDLVGLGCGAAIPALRAASAILAMHPAATVACVAVEICSAAFYLDNDPGVIISACLFGDGAAATVWRANPGALGLRCHSFDTVHDPDSRDLIRFEQREGKLRNLLHHSVPALAAKHVQQLHARATRGDQRKVSRLVTHSGGKDVLAEISKSLPDYDLEDSRKILLRHGNMSSPSVVFAFEEALRRARPSHDADWLLTSFGAGFSAHACRVTTA